jgi:hypothetical protein
VGIPPAFRGNGLGRGSDVVAGPHAVEGADGGLARKERLVALEVEHEIGVFEAAARHDLRDALGSGGMAAVGEDAVHAGHAHGVQYPLIVGRDHDVTGEIECERAAGHDADERLASQEAKGLPRQPGGIVSGWDHADEAHSRS